MRAPVHERFAGQTFATRAVDIVRSCVHCGFCNATCPTYQLTGDELEGPRGRIYLLKGMLEDGAPSAPLRQHLDQCLLCRNCESTCPSGVRYGELVELLRPTVYAGTGEGLTLRLKRAVLKRFVPSRWFAVAIGIGRVLRPLLPATLRALVPPPVAPLAAPRAAAQSTRRILMLDGCAQPVLNPNIDAAAALVFERLSVKIDKPSGSGCCGALALHLGDEDAARAQARRNIDAWWPAIEAGAEAIVATSSGCGVQLKAYGELLADDATYGESAARVAALVRDPVEQIDAAALKPHLANPTRHSVAFQAPCTLQHGQKLPGRVEQLLVELGFDLRAPAEPHLCCGSAGAYSLMHPETSAELRERKLGHLEQSRPDVIATANIGCQVHLTRGTTTPVLHWLELVERELRPRARDDA